MTDFFLSILNVSFTASVVALAVIVLRLLFKKAPRWITCLLWALVGLRLMIPFSFESSFSLIPSTDLFTKNQVHSTEAIKIHTGAGAFNHTLNDAITSMPQPEKTVELMDVLSVVWICVSALVLIYGIISYALMYLRVSTAIPLKKNIYQSEKVKSPFVLGFFKPRVYIPFNLSGRTLKYVLAHEEAHIRRKDHITKPFAFLLLSFHWFNPLMWISYVLLCRDIEVACDEKVIRDFSINKRKNYAFALLNCKVNRSNIAVCPVAFGEVNVSTRIKNTLCYKRPAVWLIAVAIGISVISACCLLTDPKPEKLPAAVPVIEAFVPEIPTEPQQTIPLTQPVTQPVTQPATTLPAETEAVITEAEEYYEEEYYEEEYYEDEPMLVVPDPIESYMEKERERITNLRYALLKSETSNHADSCQCGSCDELREAGIKPIVYLDTSQVQTIPDFSMPEIETEYFVIPENITLF